MVLKCVIIDDEKSAIDLLTEYIAEIPYIQLYKTFRKPLEALAELSASDEIDLILLDIDMPLLSGIELAKSIRDKTKYLVFTTGCSGYGSAAFDLRANQYLLKPIPFAKFVQEMDILMKAKMAVEVEHSPNQDATAFIKGSFKNSYIPVTISEITYIEALKNYVKIFVHVSGTQQSNMVITYLSIKEVENYLNPEHFIRISRSYIVAKKEIKEVVSNTLILKNGVKLELGGQYRADFLQYIKANTIKAL